MNEHTVSPKQQVLTNSCLLGQQLQVESIQQQLVLEQQNISVTANKKRQNVLFDCTKQPHRYSSNQPQQVVNHSWLHEILQLGCVKIYPNLLAESLYSHQTG